MYIFFVAGSKTYLDLLREQGVENILISYFYMKKSERYSLLEKLEFKRIFLDSGAFTAQQTGKTIKVSEYGGFLEWNKNKIYCAANFDFGTLEQQAENQIELEKYYPVFPVFHHAEYVGKTYRYLLEEFCQKYDLIALGGMNNVRLSKNELQSYLDWCFSIIMKYPKVRVHGFGQTNPELLKRYPFFSVDSTSWLTPARFGTNLVWKNFRASTLNYKDINSYKKGIHLGDVNSYLSRCAETIKEFINMQNDITYLWEKRGIKWADLSADNSVLTNLK